MPSKRYCNRVSPYRGGGFQFRERRCFSVLDIYDWIPQIDIHENRHALPGDEHRVRFDLRILSVPILLRTGDFRGFQLWRPAKFIFVNERVLVRNYSCSWLGTLHSHGFTRRSVHLLRRS